MYSPGPVGMRPVGMPMLSSQQRLPPLPPPLQPPPPPPPPPDTFWQRRNIHAHLARLLENLAILKSLGDELEVVQSLRDAQGNSEEHTTEVVEPPGNETSSIDQRHDGKSPSERNSTSKEVLRGILGENAGRWSETASFGAQAARNLLDIIRGQLEPLQGILDGSAGPEKVLAAKMVGYKRNKVLRNRKCRTKKRQRVAEALRKEKEFFEDADREADEWRAREIAKVIAKRKMDKMRELAEKSLKEEKARKQEEADMILILEKLQELRALRILKLKKQGHFFPDEDDQFVARVRAAFEEEERQEAAAISTGAATAAIQNAEEARKAATAVREVSEHDGSQKAQEMEEPSAPNDAEENSNLTKDDLEAGVKDKAQIGEGHAKTSFKESESSLPTAYEGLPPEFYKYYYSSSFDMATLIEVRQAWDAFIMPGGSRIPQHWIEAPPPADAVWASYLVQKKRRGRRRAPH